MMPSVDMPENAWMSFPALDALPGFRHRFTLRHPLLNVEKDREQVIESLWDWHASHAIALGFDRESLKTADQIHGIDVAVIDAESHPQKTRASDGLITNLAGVALGIYVADCCAVYLVDPVNKACGIVHSGKKGTEGNITGIAVRILLERFGSDPGEIIVQLSPCIRPPAYEVDIAAVIRDQAIEAGIRPQNLHDSGICTSSDLSKFYSYRMEKGKTGRMLALLGRID